jgi:type IV secretion system protein VirD4
MKRFLYLISVFMSWIGSLLPKAEGLYRARFALPHEVSRLVTQTFEGTHLLVSRTHLGGIVRIRSTPDRRELGNLLVVAPTRGGKSLLAISQLLTWPHSVIVNDPKGELRKKTAGYRATLGPVYVIDPRGFGNQYDPLHGATDEDSLYAAAKHLLYEPREGDGKAFTEQGIKMVTLTWQAARELNQRTGANHRLLPFTRLMADMGFNRAAKTIHAISPQLATRLLDGDYDPETDYNRDYKYFANSWQSVTARLYPLLTQHMVRCFDGSDFTGKDIIAGPKPVTVYLCWPESTLLAKTALIRLVLESLLSEMLETYDDLPGETMAEKGCREVLFLFDEAGTVYLPSLRQYVATVAGRNISIWAAIQDFAQLDELYGPYNARIIRNNMGIKICYRQEDYETALAIVRFLGDRSGYAHSHTTRHGQEASESLGEQAVNLLTPRDITELDPEDVIVFFSKYKPFQGKRMDPNAFPLLKARRAMPPPPLTPLPALSEIVLPSSWQRRGTIPRFPIDLDDLN